MPSINSLNLQTRPQLAEESTYEKKPVSQKVQEALIKMSVQKDIQYDAHLAYEKLFLNDNRWKQGDRDFLFTFNQLDSAIRTQCDLIMDKQDVIDLLTYFCPDHSTNEPSRIHFVQGMKPWVAKTRPQFQNQGANQQQLQHQNSFNQSQGQNSMNQYNQSPIQPGFQQQNNSGYQNQPNYAGNPVNQIQRVDGQGANFVNQYPIQGGAPMGGQPLNPQFNQTGTSQNFNPTGTNNNFNQHPVVNQNMTNNQNYNQSPNQNQNFNQNLNQNPNFNQNHTAMPPNPIANQIQALPPPNVGANTYASQVRTTPQEENVFKQICQYYSQDLDLISEALRRRKTGLFKHLSGHSVTGNSLTQEEFDRNITLLDLVQIPSNTRYQIFSQLVSLTGGQYVLISTIEALFKANSSQKAPKVNKDSVIQQIVTAFNTDLSFIQGGLQRKSNQLESFIEFFEQYPSYMKFYTTESIQILGEMYLIHNGVVNLQAFFTDLLRVQQSYQIQRNPNFEGIQKETRIDNVGLINPLMPNMSQDCTKTANLGKQNKPYYFIPPMDDFPVEEIIKGCHVVNKLVEDHFQPYQKNGVLTMRDFTSAVSALRSSLQISQSEALFTTIDKVMTNNQPIGQITPSTIDQYIHFACKTSLTKLQESLMMKLVERVTVRNFNLQAQFQMRDKGTRTIAVTDFNQTLLDLDPSLRDNDIPFLSKKYSNGIDFMYVKFMDDFNQANRLYLTENQRQMPEVIAEGLKKRLYLLKADLSQYLRKHFQAQYISQSEFSEVFGTQLELVPQICQASALVNIFIQVSKNSAAPIDEIVRYFEMKCPRDHHSLKEDLVKLLKQNSLNIRRILEQDRDVQMYGSISISQFEAIMTREFKISSLDANFLAEFYIKSGSIDINLFLTEVTGSQKGDSSAQKLKEVLANIKNAANYRNVQLAQVLGYYQVGSNRYSIAKNDFFKEINRFYPDLSPQDQNLIEETFTSASNQRDIDHVRFMDDLRGAVQQPNNKVALTLEQQQLMNKVKQYLQTEEEMRNTLVRSIAYADPANRGYLSMAKMQQALKDTANVKSKNGQIIFRLTEQNVNLLISTCQTDSFGDFNYSQLLDELVGKAQVQAILNKRADAGVNQQRPIQVSNSRLAEVSKKVFSKQKLIEEQIVKISKQKVNGVPLISEQDFGFVLQQNGVILTVDERQELQNMCNVTRDNQGLNNPLTIFKELSLTPIIISPAQSKTAPKPKVLSDQELRGCQDLINEVRRDIMRQGKKPEQMVQNVNGTTIGPAEFMKTLKGSTTEAVKEKLTNQAVGNLMHYLYKDEPGNAGRVNVTKLMQALSLPEQSPPLRQDGIDDAIKYMNELNRKITTSIVPFPIYELHQFMRNKNNMSLGQLLNLQQNQLTADMSVQTFEQLLADQGFVPKERNELIKCLQNTQTGAQRVSISSLQKFIKDIAPKQSSSSDVKQKYGRMTAVTRNNISQISQYMQRNNISIDVLHKQLDINNDGSVDKKEFVEGIYGLMKPCPITNKDLGDIFDSIDVNGDHYLSVNEFSLFLEGAKMTNKQKIDKMDPRLVEDVTRQIFDLFKQLDKTSRGFITHVEIFTTMKGLKHPITEEKAKEMVKSVDLNGDGAITPEEFVTLLKPILLEELVSKESSVEDIRSMFKEADTDYSGFLSIDEMYVCMLKMGVNVSREEIIKLFMEFDINGDMQIDIDEFVSIMSFGDDIQFAEQDNVQTYMKIKQARKINVLDFAKIFNNLPQSFVPSFYTERWQSKKKNLPSSGLKAQIDPKTMGWKDMLPLLTEQITPEYHKQGIKIIRPIPTSFGCQITIDSAEGVPLPAEGKDFDRQNIVKRVVRVGLFDTVKQDLIFNSTHVVAKWDASHEDIWTMTPGDQASSLNPILMRTTKDDNLDKAKVVIVFELVVYVKNGNKTTEMSCGWAQVDLTQCERELTKFKLEIKGGTPMSFINIADDDVRTKRSGMKGLIKMFNSNIKSTLIVTIQPHSKIDDASRVHMDFLPSTCVIPKKLVSFVSGYRNYAAEILKPNSSGGSMKKPSGDVVMSTFPKIMDCPDVLEKLVLCWTEDVINKQDAGSKRSIELAVTKTKEYVTKLYPVFFAEEFGYQLSNITESACGDLQKMNNRDLITTSALRFNNKDAKKPAQKSIATNYKPFNIREIEFDIWEDGHEQKQEGFLRRFDQAGMIAAPTR